MRRDRESDEYKYTLSAREERQLSELHVMLDETSRTMSGYPNNTHFDFRPLYHFFDFHINNIGDPFGDSLVAINTHSFERDVIRTVAPIFKGQPADLWGYVTTGGTEGNIFGTFLGRERFPDGILYYSEDTHYSGEKTARLLRMRTERVPSQPNGEMDYDRLFERATAHRDAPAIVFANIGTTMLGAVDNVITIRETLERAGIASMHIHADEALSGMILPYVRDPQPHAFSDGIDSLAFSGHKMLGCPFPCGIVLAKKARLDSVAHSVEYIGARDMTLSGSRNGHAALFLWYAFKRYAEAGMRDMVSRCIATAEYAINKFQEAGIPVLCNRNSITIVLPRPSEELTRKWSLAPTGDKVHLITVPQVTKQQIDLIVADYVDEGVQRED